jgi:hypothetical protein
LPLPLPLSLLCSRRPLMTHLPLPSLAPPILPLPSCSLFLLSRLKSPFVCRYKSSNPSPRPPILSGFSRSRSTWAPLH